jgi:hypothetical protein
MVQAPIDLTSSWSPRWGAASSICLTRSSSGAPGRARIAARPRTRARRRGAASPSSASAHTWYRPANRPATISSCESRVFARAARLRRASAPILGMRELAIRGLDATVHEPLVPASPSSRWARRSRHERVRADGPEVRHRRTLERYLHRFGRLLRRSRGPPEGPARDIVPLSWECYNYPSVQFSLTGGNGGGVKRPRRRAASLLCRSCSSAASPA